MKYRTTPWLLLAGLTFGCAVHAAPPQAAGAEHADTAAADLTVAIDPKTGKLRQPTAAEVQALQTKAAAMTPRSALQQPRGARTQPRTAAEARATQRSHRSGARSMQVPESAMSQMTATRAADGTLHISEDASAQPIRTEVTE